MLPASVLAEPKRATAGVALAIRRAALLGAAGTIFVPKKPPDGRVEKVRLELRDTALAIARTPWVLGAAKVCIAAIGQGKEKLKG